MLTRDYRLDVRASTIDRSGCFAAEPIPADTVFREYTGEPINRAEAVRREADLSRGAIYTFWTDGDLVIDGLFGGNETIYVNHSCEPNCGMLEDAGRIYFVAARDIAAGEELTIDYAYDPATPLEPCRCGAASCRGYLNEVVGA